MSTHRLDVSTCTPLSLNKTQTSGNHISLRFLGFQAVKDNGTKYALCVEHSYSR